MPANTNKPTPPSKKAIFPNPKSCSGFSTRETKLGFLSSTNGLLGLLLAEKGSCSGLLPWGPTGEGAPLAKILEATLLRQLPCLESLNTLQNHARLMSSQFPQHLQSGSLVYRRTLAMLGSMLLTLLTKRYLFIVAADRELSKSLAQGRV